MDTARQIQLSILPAEVPAMAGLDIAARYIPMNAVAGDFYDFLVIDDHRIGILVADVSGHGMPAALIASMLKIAFAAQAAHAADPVQVLSGLNQTLCGKFQDHYVTAAYAVVDTARQALYYAGAGHPPLLLRERSTGAVRAIAENGLFLGFFPHASYTCVEVPFREGDALLLYTDGVSDMTAESEEPFGEERLKTFLVDHLDLPAAGFADALIDALSGWSGRTNGREAEDDVTLLTVRFRGAEAADPSEREHV
jgi:serine phosphatase RsbU (regulator of sigma subunit)